MKKLIFLPFILLLIVMAGCTQQKTTINTTPKISNTTEQADETASKSTSPVLEVTQKGDTNYLVLNKNGQQVILIEGKMKNQDDPTNISVISNPRFSPDKNYILYDNGTYFGDLTEIYDINKSETIDRGDVGKTGFSSDGKYFYKCRTGRGGYIEAIIKSVPNLDVVFDVFGKQLGEGQYERNSGFNDLDCTYDRSKQQIKFTLYENWQEEDRGNTKTLYYPEK